mgnify:CR=1 FL=1
MTNNTNLEDLNVLSAERLITPAELKEMAPISEAGMATVANGRKTIKQIIERTDPRLFLVIGPCSIHDPEAALDYAKRLQVLAEEVSDTLYLVMRVYFEKPRTTVGWKGLISDPDLDKSFHVAKGLNLARNLLMKINKLGLPAGTEFLDMVTGQYISDLISWGAIGARTTESQVHRELASALSCPVGFKNGTDGNVQIAVDAIKASSVPHVLYSPDKSGQMCIYQTHGNPFAHVILRGGKTPNYHQSDIEATGKTLAKAGLTDKVMIDCSHGNSYKDHNKQIDVARSLAEQIQQGNQSVFGVMIESFLVAGNQKVLADQPLTYGQSITDACINLDTSEEILDVLANAVNSRMS